MVLLHPSFEGVARGRGCGFDNAHGIKKGLIGESRTGLERAPGVAIRPGVHGIEVVDRDPIPAAGRDFGLHNATGKLETGMPRDRLALPKLRSPVVAATGVGDFFGGILPAEFLVAFEHPVKGFRQGGIANAQVVVEVKMGDLLGVGIGGKAFLGISGEFVGQGDIDPEEVVDRIFILLCGESTHVHAAQFGKFLPVGFDERSLHRLEKRGEVTGLGTFLLFRGHFSGFDPLENPLPDLPVLRIGGVEGQVEEIEIRLGIEVVVTGIAMAFQERLNFRAEVRRNEAGQGD